MLKGFAVVNPRMETRLQRLPRKVWVRMLTGGIQRNVEIPNHEDHKRIGKMTDGKFSAKCGVYILQKLAILPPSLHQKLPAQYYVDGYLQARVTDA